MSRQSQYDAMMRVGVSASSIQVLRELFDEAGLAEPSEGDLRFQISGLRDALQVVGTKDDYGSKSEWVHAAMRAVYDELTELVDFWGLLAVDEFGKRLQKLLNGTMTITEKEALGNPKFEWKRFAKAYHAWEAATDDEDAEAPPVNFDMSPPTRQVSSGAPRPVTPQTATMPGPAELQEMRTHFAAVRAGLEQRLAELERAVHRRVRSCARRHRCSFHQAVCCAGGFCVGQGNAANCGLHCACH